MQNHTSISSPLEFHQIFPIKITATVVHLHVTALHSSHSQIGYCKFDGAWLWHTTSIVQYTSVHERNKWRNHVFHSIHVVSRRISHNYCVFLSDIQWSNHRIKWLTSLGILTSSALTLDLFKWSKRKITNVCVVCAMWSLTCSLR